ncbi:DIP1984 family protein [Candidatus Leptofilum sp.]|uniref:DIP1984 family protein n=1 Tax=Candidatus Leptofilum sp. TaxID=3241576 RepID=UPI003B5BF2A4
MKLAEALILRADAQKRIEQLKQRLLDNAKVQQGDKPGESPAELIDELEELAATLSSLIQKINRTNVNTYLDNETTVADALALRDILKLKHGVYRDLAKAATITQGRFTRSEIKFVSTVNISEIQQTADSLAREHRELDAAIQAVNWTTDLID